MPARPQREAGSIYAIVKQMLKQCEPSGNELDAVFQALADPSRRAMVDQLTQGPTSVSELARPLAMSLPAVVQHLHVLEASGLVRSEKLGRVRTCTVQPTTLRAAERWIAERRTFWEQSLDRLGGYLAEEQSEPAGRHQPRKRSKK
jgi:DNA-binding transcriptional ArsR family regulator